MGFAKECWPFVLPFLGLAVVLLFLGEFRWAAVVSALGLLVLLFFRIPTRNLAPEPGAVWSPANGKVLKIDTIEDPSVGPGTYHRIVIFLSVFNVHVQRSPIEGRVVDSSYLPGRKLAAFDPRAGDVNEQQLTVILHSNGDLVGVRQIAGLLARRVVTYLHVGQEVTQGQLIGVIKFGSRVDLIVPVSYHVEVETGQQVIEGDTCLARRESETS